MTFYPSDEYDSTELERQFSLRAGNLIRLRPRPDDDDDDDDDPPTTPVAATPPRPLPQLSGEVAQAA